MAGDEPERKLLLFNSMTKQKEEFKPIVEGKASMYVCGVTPYDLSHIGHARAYVAFDVLHRHLGYEVTYVRNFTDIDDKIIKRANEAGEDPLKLSKRFSDEFLVDMAMLQCLPPTHEPRVTDHMDQIRDMITKIVENGHAYTIEETSISLLTVSHSIAAYQDTNWMTTWPVEVVKSLSMRERKILPTLPCGSLRSLGSQVGRPGWHIERSAMSAHYLGLKFDIHGGGKDLVFPHQENELAQSQAANPESCINCWMHNGFVNKDNQKMSKSDNNLFTIRDEMEQILPECRCTVRNAVALDAHKQKQKKTELNADALTLSASALSSDRPECNSADFNLS